MSVKIIQERLNSFKSTNPQEEEYALKEIFQEIALAALARTDFSKYAVFQGGTALRIFYSLQRFSEDLDFLLKKPDRSFQFEKYLPILKEEFQSYGIKISIQDRTKIGENVKKIFLKEDSAGRILILKHLSHDRSSKILKIKLELDVNPPMGGKFETKYLDFPFPFSMTIQDLPSLFAGKSHALLCREYIKGRDWYDFVWYIARKTPVNFQFLTNACQQVGHWKGKNLIINKKWYIKEFTKKVKSMDWQKAKADIVRFLNVSELKTVMVWSRSFFLDRIQKLEEYL